MGMVFEEDASGAWNEMFEAPDQPRSMYERLFAELDRYERDELRQRSEQLSHTVLGRGVTFAHSGEERPFHPDLMPRLVGAAEWDLLYGASARGSARSRPSLVTSTRRAASSVKD